MLLRCGGLPPIGKIGRVLAMDVWRPPPFTFLQVFFFFRVAFSELLLRGVAPLDRPEAERQLRGKGVARPDCRRAKVHAVVPAVALGVSPTGMMVTYDLQN